MDSSVGTDFEPRQRLGGFFTAAQGVLFSPARFFSGIRREGSLRGPLAFAAICGFLTILLSGLYELGTQGEIAFPAGGVLADVPGVYVWAGIALFVPILAVVGAFITGLVYQILVRIIVGQENGGYDSSVRVAAYAYAIALLSWVPVVGVLADLWGVWVVAAGLREMHSTSTGRALAASLVVFLVGLAFTIGSIVSGELTVVEYVFGGPGGRSS